MIELCYYKTKCTKETDFLFILDIIYLHSTKQSDRALPGFMLGVTSNMTFNTC